MATDITTPTLPNGPQEPIPPLRHGDRLTRDEFERRYNAMPEINKAELIEGVVYMPSPVAYDHSESQFDLISWLGLYEILTPGVQGGDNGSIRLDMGNMPQPDAYLRILQSHGGQARLSRDRYVEGSPEWIGEVAVSSIGFDLTTKLEVYRCNGVREYLIWRVPDRAIDWFVLRGEQFEPLPLTPPGWYRSEVFPGLWLDPAALVRGDKATVAKVAQQGLVSPEHMAFVKRLEEIAAAQP